MTHLEGKFKTTFSQSVYKIQYILGLNDHYGLCSSALIVEFN